MSVIRATTVDSMGHRDSAKFLGANKITPRHSYFEPVWANIAQNEDAIIKEPAGT